MDHRPENCRARIREEGRPVPKTCQVCSGEQPAGVCPYRKSFEEDEEPEGTLYPELNQDESDVWLAVYVAYLPLSLENSIAGRTTAASMAADRAVESFREFFGHEAGEPES